MKYKVNFEISFRRHALKGKFIALEGNEGSGKTTQAHDLVKQLCEKGVKAIYTKEPTDGEIGKMIRRVLKGELKFDPLTLQYLFCADRVEHQKEIEKYLKEGYTVVTDRCFWSAVAYGLTDKRSYDDFYLTALCALSLYDQFISPDFTFYLDVDVKNALSRISGSKDHMEIYDKQEMMEKVDATYKKLVERFADEFIVIDANKSEEETTAQILAKVSS